MADTTTPPPTKRRSTIKTSTIVATLAGVTAVVFLFTRKRISVQVEGETAPPPPTPRPGRTLEGAYLEQRGVPEASRSRAPFLARARAIACSGRWKEAKLADVEQMVMKYVVPRAKSLVNESISLEGAIQMACRQLMKSWCDKSPAANLTKQFELISVNIARKYGLI